MVLLPKFESIKEILLLCCRRRRGNRPLNLPTHSKNPLYGHFCAKIASLSPLNLLTSRGFPHLFTLLSRQKRKVERLERDRDNGLTRGTKGETDRSGLISSLCHEMCERFTLPQMDLIVAFQSGAGGTLFPFLPFILISSATRFSILLLPSTYMKKWFRLP